MLCAWKRHEKWMLNCQKEVGEKKPEREHINHLPCGMSAFQQIQSNISAWTTIICMLLKMSSSSTAHSAFFFNASLQEMHYEKYVLHTCDKDAAACMYNRHAEDNIWVQKNWILSRAVHTVLSTPCIDFSWTLVGLMLSYEWISSTKKPRR